jgi:ribosomal RNA-processing protein 1
MRLTIATDKQTRDQALESLKAYLGAQTEISELDLLKLWKGLFYCIFNPPSLKNPAKLTKPNYRPMDAR